jgi:glutamate---cysteine ligase / carboxylate-amine ligase
MVSSLIRPRSATPAPADMAFRFGIEEEYFLASAETMRPVPTTPNSLFKELPVSGRQLERELLQAQLEVSTRPHRCTSEARSELRELRTAASDRAAAHGLAILACGTHPVGNWRQSVQTPKERYAYIMESLQMLGHRNMLCAMHVHVEVPDPSRRVEIMARALPYVPLLLALSTSSPFWEACLTGLKGYRLAAYDELPRTGLPDLFTQESDYHAYLQAMRRSGAISDASHVWWSIRPAQHYPTLELRAPDCCTRIDDGIAIAALYRVIVRHLYLNPEHNRALDVVDRALAVENKWRAQRYGVQATFVSREGAVPIASVLESLVENMADDIAALDCEDELHQCRSILAEGSSADAQLRVYQQHQSQGSHAALQAVSHWIKDATLAA